MVNLHRQGKVAIFVLIFCLLSPLMVYVASAQSTTVTAEASSSQLKIGDTLTVTLKVSNAVDLYGVDVTLDWNTSVLSAVSSTNSLGVESNPNGVLHQSAAYPIDIVADGITDGEYHLAATSTGSSTPSFSGSGTLATLVFNVTGSGSAGLALDVELSTRDSAGNISLVTPQTDVATVTAAIPEFPFTALILGLGVASAAAVVIALKISKARSLRLSPNTKHI